MSTFNWTWGVIHTVTACIVPCHITPAEGTHFNSRGVYGNNIVNNTEDQLDNLAIFKDTSMVSDLFEFLSIVFVIIGKNHL